MQVGLLPETAPELPGIQVFGQSIPAKDVGGDFFDYLSCLDETKSLIAVADISGKGMYAAMNAVMASGILQLTSKQHNNAATIMAEVNDALCQSLKSDMNATIILAEIDPADRTMTI
ncbi:TPA: serine/threonine protein phosphatase, partial [Candidatus Poribacteria bacterium]|nr:serine/threonine protein phosphatase [Candidatus Poribacteria bacterium]